MLGLPAITALIEVHGRPLATEAVRTVLERLRLAMAEGNGAGVADTAEAVLVRHVDAEMENLAAISLRKMFNLTGTVLHTNLGRAPLPDEAIKAMAEVAGGASNLEFDVATGRRGDRDNHLIALIRRLTGAEAATVVNNNAAAVLLVLNTLALRKEVPVSRGELIEIGDAFRMPDIMARAGCRLVEVGTTNRTHDHDFADAVTPRTTMIMKVHTSNYVVQGFTAEVEAKQLSTIAHGAGLPLAIDLGAGALVDLTRYGLPHEPTVAETLADGADLVTFSGDKLLGGPQAGIIAGRKDLIQKIKRNPMKRALRVDKMTIAALAAVLALHTDPDRLATRLPALRLLSRPKDEIDALAKRIVPPLAARLAGTATVGIVPCDSQIGSGAQPVQNLPSVALAIRPEVGGKGTGSALKRISGAFCALPIPVIGRVQDDALLLDLRCLTDEAGFLGQIDHLSI